MEAVIEKECSALGGLFQTIISDMKVRNCQGLVGTRVRGHFSLPSPAKLCIMRCSRIRGRSAGVTCPSPALGCCGVPCPTCELHVPCWWKQPGKGPLVNAAPSWLESCLQDTTSLLSVSPCSNMQAVTLHQSQGFPNTSLLFGDFFIRFLAILGCQITE